MKDRPMAAMRDEEVGLYLARIGLGAAPDADPAGLTAIQRGQRQNIPFENLDIRLGRRLSLEPDVVFGKLVSARRGGYCFEQNGLFLRALAALGFEARPLLARVWLAEPPAPPPHTHTLNLVRFGDEHWSADAGFGGSDAPPMRLAEREIVSEDGVRHLLRRDPAHGWMLLRNGAPQYSFTEAQAWSADLALANHWTATAPESRFVQLTVVSILSPEGLISLTGSRLSRGGEAIELAGAEAFRAALGRHFGISLSADEAARLAAG